MDTTSGEITVQDLLSWEPRLTVVSPRPNAATRDEALGRDVEWVTTARANAPMLPSVRGGELVILPRRIVQETGIPFARLVNEMMLHPIAGILTEGPVPELPDTTVAVLATSKIEPETEGELNRLLASRRRELLALASDVDRLIADAQARGERPGEVLGRLAKLLDMPMSIQAGDGAVLISTSPAASRGVDRSDAAWVGAALRSGRRLWFGPVPPHLRARARMTIGHVQDGMQRLLDREASSVPRGSARSSALRMLLLPEPSTRPETLADIAYQAGIAPGRTLHVALAPPEQASHHIRRILSPLGDSHDAGTVDGLTALVAVALPAGTRAVVPQDEHMEGWIAVSGAVLTSRELPEATRQARYVARLLQQGALAGPVARFDDDAKLGLYRLLYPQWGSTELARYRSSLLGQLRQEDRHGALVETLRVFLEEGGSLRPAAERLGIHRNTLAYRLRQIRQAIDADLDSPPVRLGLQVALVAESLPAAPEQA